MPQLSNIVPPPKKRPAAWQCGQFFSFLVVEIGGPRFEKDCNVLSLTFKSKVEEDAYLDHFIRRFGSGNTVCCFLTLLFFVGLWLITAFGLHLEILPQFDVAYARPASHVCYFCCCWFVGLLYLATRLENMRKNIEWWMLISCGGIFVVTYTYLITETARYTAHWRSKIEFGLLSFRLWACIFLFAVPEWLTGLTFFFFPARTKFASLALAFYFAIGVPFLFVYLHILKGHLPPDEGVPDGLPFFLCVFLLYVAACIVYLLSFACGRWYSELHDRVEFWRTRRCQEQIEFLKMDRGNKNGKEGVGTAVEDLMELLLAATAAIQDAATQIKSELLTESVGLLNNVQHLLTQSNVYDVYRAPDEVLTTAGSDEDELETRFFDLYTRREMPVRGLKDFACRLPRKSQGAHDVGLELQPLIENSRLGEAVGSTWNFAMLSMAETTPHILSHVGYLLLKDHCMNLNISLRKLHNYLYVLERLHRPNPYHNQVHGASVAHALECLLKMVGIVDAPFYCPTDKAAITIAALGHNVGHPGRMNQFFVGSFNVIALLWNDRAVLENYHAAWVLKLLENENCNILESFDVEATRSFRKDVINLISAMDMSAHFDMVSKFKLKRQIQDFNFNLNQEDFWLVVQMCMKVADLNHTLIDWDQHLEWALRITEEFYQQGEEEAALGLPISLLCDRSRHSDFARSQKGFLEVVVQPLYNQLEELDTSGQLKTLGGVHFMRNKSKWEELSTEGEIIEIPDRISAMTTTSREMKDLAVRLLLPKDYTLESLLLPEPSSPPAEGEEQKLETGGNQASGFSNDEDL